MLLASSPSTEREDYISSFVYVVNFVTAFFGYRKWGQLMK